MTGAAISGSATYAVGHSRIVRSMLCGLLATITFGRIIKGWTRAALANWPSATGPSVSSLTATTPAGCAGDADASCHGVIGMSRPTA